MLPRDDELFLRLQSTHRMLRRYHPEVGHLFVPGLRARIPWEGGGYFVRTNALGFRSDVEFQTARRGLPRIVFLGDSFTAGDGVDNHERFSELAGDALGAEVFNYAVSGTGTDQQVLIYERFARDVDADLIVFAICVENIERNLMSHRASIDRTTHQRVMVPKPYFTLARDGRGLELHHVPVPRERPVEEGARSAGRPVGWIAAHPRSLMARVREAYRRNPALLRLGRRVQESAPEIWTRLLRQSGVQPYEDYASPESPGWQLMRAILERFVAVSAPTPVLIVPIPEHRYYQRGAEPLYQPHFESLASADGRVQVMDLTTPLVRLPREERRALAFHHDVHFAPAGHRKVAELLAAEIRERGLVKTVEARDSRTVGACAPRRARTSTAILGLSCFYHNSAAALVRDGEIVAAAEEERFTRVKNDPRFPHYAANYCLEEGGLHARDLAAVVYYDQAPLTFERLMHTEVANGERGEESWMRVLPMWTRFKLHLPQLIRRHLAYEGLLLHDAHHRSHAASAFYPSPFERAATLTIDGVGEWATASIGRGHGNEIRLLREMHFPHSLGLLYSAFTQFTGFNVNSGEYKMMGLAPYGEPRYADVILEHLVKLNEDGSLELNLEYFAFLGKPTMTNEKFATLFGGPARPPESRITRREMDLARSVQWVTEEAMLRMARHAHRLTGEENLCLAGGVALNCVANGRILREGPFRNLWIQPAAGDAGSALGAALDVHHTWFGNPRTPAPGGRSPQRGSCLGPGFSDAEITAFAETYRYPHRRLEPAARADAVAGLLAEGKVVGHFAGRLEYGPRALGSRSIVGDARNDDMCANLNMKIKYRESFRPFAPTVLAERVSDYFELDRESPYMLLVASVKRERQKPFRLEFGDKDDMLSVVRRSRSDIPAVTHVDYSARVQTVHRDDHPLYHDLIAAFERKTGYAVIVNTSFNVRGEPIVCTPYDAYRCFMRTEMDALVLENCLFMKVDQPPWPEAKGHIERHGGEVREGTAEDTFTRGLREIFRRRFLPAAAAIRERRLADRAGSWLAAPDAIDREAIFRIPAALDRADPDAHAMAEALVSSWAPTETTRLLRAVVEDLVELGLRHRPSQGEGFPEEVPEAIYVLY